MFLNLEQASYESKPPNRYRKPFHCQITMCGDNVMPFDSPVVYVVSYKLANLEIS